MKLLAFSWDGIKDAVYDFFHPTFENYTNFEISEYNQSLIPMIVFAIFVGVFLAAVYSVYLNYFLGKLVRKLNSEEIFSPDRAKTLSELGFSKNVLILQALRGRFSLRRVVHSVELDAHLEAKTGEEFRFSPKTEHFYIPEENKHTAMMRFGKQRTTPVEMLFTLLGIAICLGVVFACLPELVRLFDNVVSIFSVKGNTIH